MRSFRIKTPDFLLLLGFLCLLFRSGAEGAPLPGGTLDPNTIPKFVIPLVIPPVMKNNGTADQYQIAVRQFQQQILPGGIWNLLNGRADAFPATTVWSYGPQADPAPDASGVNPSIPAGVAPAPNSQFNYPAYTVETRAATPVRVRWINDLKDPVTGNYRPHLLPVDQTLHWANPPATGCTRGPQGTDCPTANPAPYTGPVPIVTHVHGSHVDPHSDGYPEAWYLPAAANIPAGYATKGRLFDDVTGTNPGNLGYADFYYRQDQPATTLWYHDHSLGMTRANVYAGPAGFWLVRGGAFDGARNSAGGTAVLPGGAPTAGQGVLALNTPGTPIRNSIREIPIVMQDRSFNLDGSLFYPTSRLFFDGYPGPYVPDTDIAPLWNPEAFFNTMVVNGAVWPALRVAPALYRFRFLNGCNARFLNLALFVDAGTPPTETLTTELPFYQIGAEQGFLPKVVKIQTGAATELPGNGTVPPATGALNAGQALLLGLAERADVLVDFRGLPHGTRIRLINTAPDSPFGGFPVSVPADPGTTGRVMEFIVDTTMLNGSPTDPGGPTPATDPWSLVLNNESALAQARSSRNVSLNEESSTRVCVNVITNAPILILPPGFTEAEALAVCSQLPNGALAGPKAAKLGIVDLTNPGAPVGMPLMWTDAMGVTKQVTLQSGARIPVTVTENPTVNTTEEWSIYNFTEDAHPIHLHLVRFQVMDRTPIPGAINFPATEAVQPWEKGFKDTVIAYPGMITKVKARFDITGLYVWHCHILEHEDNEMMRPYFVSNAQLYFPMVFTNALQP